jgi:maltose O-acetyltransferase
VSIGPGTFINHGLYVDRGPLTIGANVSIGPRVSFLTRNHEVSDSAKRAGKHVDQSIEVGAGCWIGANVTVLGGVSIASGCVVAAGAVVTRSTEPNGLYAGVPCRLVRHLGD